MDEESLKKRIRTLLDGMRNEADPFLLNQYRAVFRKEVSLFRRSYLAAWLLYLSEPGVKSSRRRNGKKTTAEPKMPKNTGIASGESTVKLFVGVGRNRRAYAGEILELFTKANIARDDIGAIRVLNNYSFVQIKNTAADSAISVLNGCNFRGKTISVNYARNKSEAADKD